MNVKLFLTASFLAISCSNKKESYSHINHAFGDISIKNVDFWFDTNDEDYHKYVVPPQAESILNDKIPNKKGFLQANHEFVQRMDFILKSLFAVADVSNIPVPRSKVIADKKQNAFAKGFLPRFVIPILFDPTTVSVVKEPIYWVFSSEGAYSGRDGGGGPTQKKLSAKELKQRKILEWMNTSYFTNGCVLKYENNKIVVGDNCLSKSLALYGLPGVPGFSTTLTSNVITIQFGITSLLPKEEHMIAVLAHELGHYMKAHPSISSDDTRFYYKIADKSPNSKAPKDPQIQRLGKLATNIPDIAGIVHKPQKTVLIKGSRLFLHDYLTYYNMVLNIGCKSDWVKGKPPTYTCMPSCQPFMKLSQDLLFRSDFEQEFLTHPEQAISYESSLETCTSTITEQNLEKKIISLTYSIEQNLKDSNKYLYECAKPLPKAKTLWEIILHLGTERRSISCDQEKVLGKVRAEKLGYYTEEQEADDIALELLIRAGIEPQYLKEAFQIFAEQEDPGCKNWKAMQGNSPVPIPGEFATLHHSSCFRMGNIDREVIAHQQEYSKPSMKKLKSLTQEQWQNLVSKVKIPK